MSIQNLQILLELVHFLAFQRSDDAPPIIDNLFEARAREPELLEVERIVASGS